MSRKGTGDVASRPIVYPLGRLISRQHSPTATGIDRLDLRHAHWLLEKQRTGDPVIFVHQVRNALILVPPKRAERLIESLCRRWLRNAGPESDVFGMLGDRARMAVGWIAGGSSSFIDVRIKRLLRGLPRPIYMNSAHIGAQFEGIHQAMRREFGARLVFYLHDVIPVDYPEYFSGSRGDNSHYFRVRVMASHGDLILVNSEYTRDRFVTLCVQEGWRVPRVEVLHIAVEDRILGVSGSGEKASGLPKEFIERVGDAPYFVVVGTIEPRKNHLLLLHIWREMAREAANGGERCPVLVIIGRRGWCNQNILDLLDRSALIRPHVVEFNGLDDEAMVAIVQHARALLMPSWDEGWGIPVTEALALGVPVICSDHPALRESSQGLGCYLSPLDGLSWLRKIRELSSEPSSVDGDYFPLSWDEHMRRLSGLLAELEQNLYV